jgi:hypothetical protein
MGKFLVGIMRVLLLCAVVLVLPAIAAAQGSVTLDLVQGPVNTGVTATGKGWPPNASVYAFFNQQQLNTVAETVDSGGNFKLNFCVPNLAPGVYPTFFTISQFPGMYSGPIFTITAGTPGNCQPTAQCPNAYFVGVHGMREGPDQGGNGDSIVISETWQEFEKLAKAKGKQVKYHSIWYPAPSDWTNIALLFQDVAIGVAELDKQIRGILKTCPGLKIALVGYSFGAWVIDDWLSISENEALWQFIGAVQLYGDPLWKRTGPPYLGGTVDTYIGVAHVVNPTGMGFPNPNPYSNTPEGPGVGLSDRWQSRCLKDDPICGEGYGFLYYGNQLGLAINCGTSPDFCEHEKYASEPEKGKKVGYGLTTRGAMFLALKTFPDVFTTGAPSVAHYETFVEGDFVYIRLYHTGSPIGFGFVGVNGSGWAQEEIPFSSPTTPYWTRVSPNDDRVEYPFNHLCSTQPGNKSDIEAWVYSSTQRSPRVRINLACSVPKEVVTPFFDY